MEPLWNLLDSGLALTEQACKLTVPVLASSGSFRSYMSCICAGVWPTVCGCLFVCLPHTFEPCACGLHVQTSSLSTSVSSLWGQAPCHQGLRQVHGLEGVPGGAGQGPEANRVVAGFGALGLVSMEEAAGRTACVSLERPSIALG